MLLQLGYALFQRFILFIWLDDIQRQLLYLLQQLLIHLPQIQPFRFHFRSSRDTWQMPVGLNVIFYFVQGRQLVTRMEDKICPGGLGDFYLACANSAFYGELVSTGIGYTDTDPAGKVIGAATIEIGGMIVGQPSVVNICIYIRFIGNINKITSAGLLIRQCVLYTIIYNR